MKGHCFAYWLLTEPSIRDSQHWTHWRLKKKKKRQKQSHGWMEMTGIVKWQMQMSTWDTVSISLWLRDLVSHRECQWVAGHPTGAASHRAVVLQCVVWSREDVWPESEDNTMWYGQKKKLWVNIAVCICLRLSLIPTKDSTPFKNKVWELYF